MAPMNDLAGAIAAGDFVSVTLTANEGFALNWKVSPLCCRHRMVLRIIAVFSDVTGFAAADAILFGDNAIPQGPIATAGLEQTVDLSSSVFDNLNSIEFRVVYR